MSRFILLAGVAAALGGLVSSDAFGARATALRANGRIAFSDATGIASMNPDGTGQWGVELNVGDTAPAWSPDGSQLAVITHWGGRNGILAMNPDGSGARPLTTDSADRDPAWSPDGSKVAFANGGRIYLVNADGSKRTPLTNGAYTWASHPTWSPDGGRIAFSAYPDGMYYATGIYVVDLSSGKESELSDETVAARNPAWSPDGAEIAFAGGGSTIDAMNADGTHVRALTSSTGYDDAPAGRLTEPRSSSLATRRSG